MAVVVNGSNIIINGNVGASSTDTSSRTVIASTGSAATWQATPTITAAVATWVPLQTVFARNTSTAILKPYLLSNAYTFSKTYDMFAIEISEVYVGGSTFGRTTLNFQFSTDDGVTWKTLYDYATLSIVNGSGSIYGSSNTAIGNTDRTTVRCSDVVKNPVLGKAYLGGLLYLWNPADTGNWCRTFYYEFTPTSGNTSTSYNNTGFCYGNGVTPPISKINQIRFYSDSGNTINGKFTIYGISLT